MPKRSKPGAVIESTAALRFDDDFIIHRARTVTDNVMLYEAWGTIVYRNALERGIGTKLNLWNTPQMMV